MKSLVSFSRYHLDARTCCDHPGSRPGQANEVGTKAKRRCIEAKCGQPHDLDSTRDAAREPGAKAIDPQWSATYCRADPQQIPPCRASTSSSRPRPNNSAPVMCGQEFAGQPLGDYQGAPVLVLVGDELLLRPEPLADPPEGQHHDQAACLLGTAVMDDPMGFGCIPARDSAGRFLRIVEERDCTPEEWWLSEVNLELLRLRDYCRGCGTRSGSDWHEQRTGRVRFHRRAGALEEHGPQGGGARLTCCASRRCPRGQYAAASGTRPGAVMQSAESRTIG